MSQPITISLPDDTKDALINAASEEGLSESALVEEAVSDYLFIRRFRSLRERMMSQGKNLTDQDVYRVPGSRPTVWTGSSSRQRREI
jgi:predicted transcriptional regulator